MIKSHAEQLILDCGLDNFDAEVDVSPIGPPPPDVTDGFWDVWIRGDEITGRDRRIQITDSEDCPGRYYVGRDEDNTIRGNVGFTVEVDKGEIHPTVLILLNGEFVFS